MYIVVRSFYEGDTLHQDGSVFTHDNNEYVEKCLADGNIAVSDATQVVQEVTADPTPLVETVAEAEVLRVQNEQVQPTQEAITEDLTVADAGSQVQPTSLNIQ